MLTDGQYLNPTVPFHTENNWREIQENFLYVTLLIQGEWVKTDIIIQSSRDKFVQGESLGTEWMYFVGGQSITYQSFLPAREWPTD